MLRLLLIHRAVFDCDILTIIEADISETTNEITRV